jgi:hypothetical protein
MKNSETIITDWLSNHGCFSVENQVKNEIQKINNIEALKFTIKMHCKNNKLKFEMYIDGGFVASRLIPIKAGMKIDIHTGNITSFPIKEIGKKRVFRKYICYSNGDIVDDGVLNVINILKINL